MTSAAPDAAVRFPVTTQRWAALTFLHWTVDPAVVQRLLPPDLRVQTHDGATYVGLVPFRMEDVRLGALPAVPGWSTFGELNLRVYVRDAAGGEGVWFSALWCERAAFVAATRLAGVPYHRCRAAVTGEEDDVLRYRFAASSRTAPVRFDARVRAHEEVDASSGLARWLTARWAAYAVRAGRTWRIPVEHPPWTLRRGSVEHLSTDALDRLGLPLPPGPPLVHVAARPVDARLGVPRPAARPGITSRG
ncbi:YqjF family protein [Cellulosimicrobium sp. Marseille-Q8652]